MSTRSEARVGWTLALAVFVGACAGPTAPPRAQGVPLSAVWAGGVDGGAWIDCRKGEGDGLFRCEVYDDFTAARVAEGLFRLEGVAADGSSATLRYSAFDGTRILLQGGGSLKPEPGGQGF